MKRRRPRSTAWWRTTPARRSWRNRFRTGLDARTRGDAERATALLGNAVKIAHESGNEATAKLLRNVVDVEDAEKGTVRLKGSVTKEAEMMLETRSTKTARIARTS